jgi:hypothetical protein
MTLQARKHERFDWVVYSKPPFGGPAQVLKHKAMTLLTAEFLRRFLQHMLPRASSRFATRPPGRPAAFFLDR